MNFHHHGNSSFALRSFGVVSPPLRVFKGCCFGDSWFTSFSVNHVNIGDRRITVS